MPYLIQLRPKFKLQAVATQNNDYWQCQSWTSEQQQLFNSYDLSPLTRLKSYKEIAELVPLQAYGLTDQFMMQLALEYIEIIRESFYKDYFRGFIYRTKRLITSNNINYLMHSLPASGFMAFHFNLSPKLNSLQQQFFELAKLAIDPQYKTSLAHSFIQGLINYWGCYLYDALVRQINNRVLSRVRKDGSFIDKKFKEITPVVFSSFIDLNDLEFNKLLPNFGIGYRWFFKLSVVYNKYPHKIIVDLLKINFTWNSNQHQQAIDNYPDYQEQQLISDQIKYFDDVATYQIVRMNRHLYEDYISSSKSYGYMDLVKLIDLWSFCYLFFHFAEQQQGIYIHSNPTILAKELGYRLNDPNFIKILQQIPNFYFVEQQLYFYGDLETSNNLQLELKQKLIKDFPAINSIKELIEDYCVIKSDQEDYLLALQSLKQQLIPKELETPQEELALPSNNDKVTKSSSSNKNNDDLNKILQQLKEKNAF